MKRKSRLPITMVTAVLALLGGTAVYAQDKYTLKTPSGIAFSETVVSIRIVRNQRAEIFAISMRDASKLGGLRLAPEHGPIDPAAKGPVSLTDHQRSYEIVSGPDWHQLVAIDLPSGQALWKTELGAAPITSGGVEAGNVWLMQGDQRRVFLRRKPLIVHSRASPFGVSTPSVRRASWWTRTTGSRSPRRRRCRW